MKIDALGFIEVRGLVPGIEAADAMLKSANVRLIRQHQVDPGLITLVVEGDLAACRAAVDAGVAAAARLGEVVVSRLEIGRPDEDTERMVQELVGRSKTVSKPLSTPLGKAAPVSPPAITPATVSVLPETENTPVPPTEDPQASQAENSAVDAIVAFIAATDKGRSWAEIVKRFPNYDGQKRSLEEMVKLGKLRKVGNRYLKPSKYS